MKPNKIKNLLWVLFSITAPALMQWWVFDSTAAGGNLKIKLSIIMYGLSAILLLILRPLMDALFRKEEEIE